MSTTSLPSYVPPPFSRTPTYTAEPQAYEQRLALNLLRQRPSGDFVKQSKTGGVSLRLIEQEDHVNLPVYGCGDSVEGTVDLAKPDNAASVEVKLEGSLRLKEIAEGGTTTHRLCILILALWSRDRNTGPCPASLPFSITLPTTFSDGKDTYPLPPSHEAHLSGVPGFRAHIEYTVSVLVHKKKSSGLLRTAHSTVSTPFIYYPRSRPAVPLPSPMRYVPEFAMLLESADWRCYESTMIAKTSGGKDIISRFYVPASRVFCKSEPIPFHLTFTSSALSLATLLPLVPTASIHSSSKQHTRIQLLRQTTVDVRNALILGTKTDIWQTVSIGQGSFKHAGDGPDWIAFRGEIRVSDQVKIGGFRAGGFSVKDCIVVTVTPPEPTKAPFSELRQVVPIRLTTDPWSNDGMGQGFTMADYSLPPTPEEVYPELRYETSA
ncbi:hypothetical protein AcW1_007354 [Taiwanofungus camphoratus]|nr:hypothetical protein AcW2_007578 [Antrodia cinnamomea]KAI0920065.1 hypothetical protein AcV7_006065 [Antrodia cinnamomea]KAI0927381.1 hypothetical protein AcV5_007934 [Antrodia cinnamomea]KAI0953030.1 hypothetical protein AcW1_007354 [Antrodia cinnamomea]